MAAVGQLESNSPARMDQVLAVDCDDMKKTFAELRFYNVEKSSYSRKPSIHGRQNCKNHFMRKLTSLTVRIAGFL